MNPDSNFHRIDLGRPVPRVALGTTLLLALGLAIGFTGLVDPPTHNTIDGITPDRGSMMAGGSIEATVFLTSDSSCLEGDADPGLEVSFSPDCGAGSWAATMTVTDHGATPRTGEVEIREIGEDASVLDHRIWEVQILTVIPGPGPSSTTTLPPTISSPPPTVSPTTTITLPTDSMPTPQPTTTTTVAPGAPTTSPPPDQPLQEQFEAAGIAFNTPASMLLGETVTVQLLLGLGDSGEDLEGSITAPGGVASADIETTCETTARLQGQNFEVLDLTEATQFVCARSRGEWLWQVTSEEEGVHNLTLTINAIVEERAPVTIRVFQRSIEIEVGFLTRIISALGEFLGSGTTAFFGAIGAAGAAWFLKRLHDRRRDTRATPTVSP